MLLLENHAWQTEKPYPIGKFLSLSLSRFRVLTFRKKIFFSSFSLYFINFQVLTSTNKRPNEHTHKPKKKIPRRISKSWRGTVVVESCHAISSYYIKMKIFPLWRFFEIDSSKTNISAKFNSIMWWLDDIIRWKRMPILRKVYEIKVFFGY